MKVYNKNNSYNTGDLKVLESHMLIGSRNVPEAAISIQISVIPVNSEQDVHSHSPEQCYYIIRGKGMMIIEDEECVVRAGDAIYIPANKKHGIKNTGEKELEYLTANTPAFSNEYEEKLWSYKK